MNDLRFRSGPCPIARGLNRIGDTWSMLILRNAGMGQTKFDEFEKSLGIAPNILTRRLFSLSEDGLLVRQMYNERPVRYQYLLTSAGRDFLPVLYALGAWGGRHFPTETHVDLVDAANGAPISPVIVDRITGRDLADVSVHLVSTMPTAVVPAVS